MTTGRVIGDRYHVEGLLGRGGTASVWLARDSRLERQVAIKELTGSWLEEPGALERFDREARTVARLAHPNIVAVHDVDIHDETPYLVMELVDGATVATMLRSGVLTVGQAVAIASQVCDGLSAAHAAGVIHRDVKPANLILTPAGVVKICDFGIARRFSDAADRGLTGSQYRIGTTSYMAPEQIRGDRVDARADLYGLGCTLYAMLTGVPPFSGAPTNVLRQHLDDMAPTLRGHRDDVPPALDALVGQLLAKTAAERPHDAAEVKARFGHVMGNLATEPVSPAPAPFRGQAPSVAPAFTDGPTVPIGARRRPWQIGVLGIVVVAIGTVAFVTTQSTPNHATIPSPASTATLDGATNAAAPSPTPNPTPASPAASSVPSVSPTPNATTTGAVQSNVDTAVTTPAPLGDPIAVMRLTIQDQVSTGNLNPDKASDLYKQVDLIAKAISTGNPDEVAKTIKPMRDKLTALRTGGQLSPGGYDTLNHALDAIAAAQA